MAQPPPHWNVSDDQPPQAAKLTQKSSSVQFAAALPERLDAFEIDKDSTRDSLPAREAGGAREVRGSRLAVTLRGATRTSLPERPPGSPRSARQSRAGQSAVNLNVTASDLSAPRSISLVTSSAGTEKKGKFQKLLVVSVVTNAVFVLGLWALSMIVMYLARDLRDLAREIDKMPFDIVGQELRLKGGLVINGLPDGNLEILNVTVHVATSTTLVEASSSVVAGDSNSAVEELVSSLGDRFNTANGSNGGDAVRTLGSVGDGAGVWLVV